MDLHQAQRQIVQSNKRFRVAVCGRRFGKSTLSAWEMFAFAFYKSGSRVVYVAPTIKQARDIVWSMLKEVTKGALAKSPNETRLELTIKCQNGETSEIWLRGTENVESLRGIRVDFLVIDEVASMSNWNTIWKEVLRPTLTDRKGQAMFIGTPRGYNHFYELYLMQERDDDYQSFKFTTYDNPFIPREEVEKARLELDEDTFAQEYLAEFKRFSGLVYKDFSREKHVIEPIDLLPNWTFTRSIDFGFVHASAVLFFAIDHTGIIYVYDEIYQAGLHTPDLSELIKQKSIGRMFTQSIADSAQQADISELNKYGISCTPVSKTSHTNTEDWTAYKVRRTSEKFKGNKIKIFKNCTNLIWELENYQYKEVKDGEMLKEVPVKLNDHACDALAYMIVSIPERVEATPEFNTSIPVQDFSSWGLA